MPYVLKDLPLDVQTLKKLLGKYTKQVKNKEAITNLVLQRLRDYHDPLASGTEDDNEINNWNKFVMAMLTYWV